MTILLVDDLAMVRENWRRAFDGLVDEIREASTLAEAYAQFSLIPNPDLVLLDLVMPGATETLTKEHVAKMRSVKPDVIILLVSGKFSDEDLNGLAQRLGTDGFAAKMDISTQGRLFDAIRPHLEKRPTLRETLSLMSITAAA